MSINRKRHLASPDVNMTPALYAQVQQLWMERYGALAGWAHAVCDHPYIYL